MHATARPKITVTADGSGVVNHAGARLLSDLAQATGLTAGMVEALAVPGKRAGGHEPGQVACDVAVMIADGGQAIADMAVLRGQRQLFGQVASDPTVWRVLDGLDRQALQRLAAARAAAREVAWAQRYDTRGELPASYAGDWKLPGLVLDIDASIVVCHSEKENATPTWKRSFGYHPILCYLDNTREALSGLLRAGRAGSNTAADHISVLDAALAQIPDTHRYGTPILVRCDSAGSSHDFLARIRSLRTDNIDIRFSVGIAITETIRDMIVDAHDWVPALAADGVGLRHGADVCEITHMLPDKLLANLPEATRLIVRRERPHPGAQLSLFEAADGYRYQVFATDTPAGGRSIQYLELRHRTHARVEDRIRAGKNTGFGRFPSRQYNINTAWLQLALLGQDLLAWTQMLLLAGPACAAEPKRLRYQLLHTAGRLTRSGRRTRLRLAAGWPWAQQLADAFTRLAALPRPAT
jgi:hypothetical protein